MAARLDTEQRAPVVDEVQLGIAAPLGKLAALVLVVERGVHPSPHQPGEDVEKGLADRSGEGEIRFEIASQLSLADSTPATMPLAVGAGEVIVLPLIESGIMLRIMVCAGQL